jgi:hypothetical protein
MFDISAIRDHENMKENEATYERGFPNNKEDSPNDSPGLI